MRVTDLARILATARAQHGVVSRAQWDDADVPAAYIRAQLRSRAWRPLCRGTYFVEAQMHEETPRLAWLSAALLALGPTATAEPHAAPTALSGTGSGRTTW